jgi:glycosyltransferase involved in cell wall biosynthesis
MTAPRDAVEELTLLVLLAYPTIDGPLPKLGPLLVRGLREHGCSVDVAFWSRHRENESILDKVRGRLMDVVQIRRLMAGREFDCVLITTTHDWPAIIRDITLLVSMSRGCPHRILHFHGSLSDRLVRRDAWLLKLASHVLVGLASGLFVLSTEELHDWQAFSHHTPVWLVRNPYEPRAHAERLSEVGASEVDVAYLFVGRLIAEKGVYELLEAFLRVTRRVPARLHIAGRGPCANEIARRVSALGLQTKVVMHGYLDDEALSRLYARCDVLVLPSYREGFPMVYLEAMDHGLAIVTTAIRGALDNLRPEENALLIPPRSVDALESAMMRLAEDPGLRRRMSTNNLRKVADYAPESVALDYLKAVRSLISGRA